MSYTKAAKNGPTSAGASQTYVTARGIALEVFAVPQPIINSIVPKRPRPEIPTVSMALPNKGTQKRPMKKGDPGWEVYEQDLSEWNREANELQEAIQFCFALKNYAFPEIIKPSPELQELIDDGLVKWPDNKYQQRLMWLRENVLGQHDEYNIRMILYRLGGVEEDVINQMKESFRNTLLGKANPGVGESDDDEPAAETGDEV